MVRSRRATESDLMVIKTLLKEGGLPSDDGGQHIGNFLVMEENEKAIGAGGLEIHGNIALVRSIVVVPEYRGKGIGRKIYELLESNARELGVHTLYLLTETASDYFKKLGFRAQSRSDVPASIKKTAQFTKLCSSSAVVMFRKI